VSSCNRCAELEEQITKLNGLLKDGDQANEENSKGYRAYIAAQAERVRELTHINRKLLDAVILARGTLGVLDYLCGEEVLLEIFKEDLESVRLTQRRLNEAMALADPIGVQLESNHGCFTGDCPHDKQEECNAEIARAREELSRSAIPKSQPGSQALDADGRTSAVQPETQGVVARPDSSRTAQDCSACGGEMVVGRHHYCSTATQDLGPLDISRCSACGGAHMNFVNDPDRRCTECREGATCPHSPPGMDPPADPSKCADCSASNAQKGEK
jgi:hypothetical protein